VADCCDPTPYRRFFNSKEAARSARSYRRRGVDSMARSMVQHLIEQGVTGSRVLEVGGGVGGIQLDLLKAGASSATNIELSSGYEEAAAELINQAGFEDRTNRYLGDFVEKQDEFDPAEIVVMNRVICCYPWMDRMMQAATGKTGRFLAIVFPRDNWWVRLAIGTGNRFLGARGCDFRAFVHPVSDIKAVAEKAGLVPRFQNQGFIWQALVLERTG